MSVSPRYRIEFSKRALRHFSDLPREIQIRLKRAVDRLAENPRPVGCTKLSAAEDLYRIRVGDYRILYQIQDKMLLVLVVEVGHRREVYR